MMFLLECRNHILKPTLVQFHIFRYYNFRLTRSYKPSHHFSGNPSKESNPAINPWKENSFFNSLRANIRVSIRNRQELVIVFDPVFLWGIESGGFAELTLISARNLFASD